MVDLVLLAGALWIAIWIASQPAEVALLYAAGCFASTYAAVHVAPWVVLHLSITRPVLAWVEQHIGDDLAVFGTGSAPYPALSNAIPWAAIRALDWLIAFLLAGAVWFSFISVHRFLRAVLDEEDLGSMSWASRIASSACGAFAGGWSMLQAAPAFAVMLHLLGSHDVLDANPLLDLMLHTLQSVPAFRTMV
ncbi:hypothetical protein [Alicyclobacillus fructus]|uniref:hypothetical protein n=1 Tax=Alicyclobacillus fructus TaxID=2816082 RepID=UPI001A8C1DB0|nr:hypothetical protein [Alicyclobacillus fructus]